MKGYRKLVSLIIVVFMITSLFIACAKERGEETSIETTTQDPDNTTEPTELEVMNRLDVYIAATWTTDVDYSVHDTNPLGKKLEKLTKTKVTFEYSTGTASEVSDKLNLKLLSGDYPDIISLASSEITARMANDGFAIALNDLIEEQGTNIKEMYGDILNRIRYEDGGVYYLPNKYGYWDGDRVPGYGNAFNIRKDAYEAAGSPDIETIDDIYDILVKLSSIYDTNENGEKIWPLGGFVQSWQNTRDVLADGAGFVENGKLWIDPNGQLKYWVRAPQALTITKFYNKLVREELIDPEAFTQDKGMFDTNKLHTGRALSLFGGWWMTWNAHLSLEQAGIGSAEDTVFLQFPFSVPGGERPNFVIVNPLGSGQTVITDNCKDPEVAIKWLDTLASHDVNFEVLNGPEGIMWEFVDGKPVMKKEYVDKFVAGAKDNEFMEVAGYRIYDRFVARVNGSTKWGTWWILKDDPETTGDKRAMFRDEQLGPYWYDASYYQGLTANSTDDIIIAYNNIDSKIMTTYYAAVLASSEEECEKKWQEYIAELENAGLKEVEEAMNEEYQRRIQAAQ